MSDLGTPGSFSTGTFTIQEMRYDIFSGRWYIVGIITMGGKKHEWIKIGVIKTQIQFREYDIKVDRVVANRVRVYERRASASRTRERTVTIPSLGL